MRESWREKAGDKDVESRKVIVSAHRCTWSPDTIPLSVIYYFPSPQQKMCSRTAGFISSCGGALKQKSFGSRSKFVSEVKVLSLFECPHRPPADAGRVALYPTDHKRTSIRSHSKCSTLHVNTHIHTLRTCTVPPARQDLI